MDAQVRSFSKLTICVSKLTIYSRVIASRRLAPPKHTQSTTDTQNLTDRHAKNQAARPELVLWRPKFLGRKLIQVVQNGHFLFKIMTSYYTKPPKTLPPHIMGIFEADYGLLTTKTAYLGGEVCPSLRIFLRIFSSH